MKPSDQPSIVFLQGLSFVRKLNFYVIEATITVLSVAKLTFT